MSDYQPETGYAPIAQVEAYWEGLRGDRLMPRRSDIDPRGIEFALEYAFIVERIAPGIARLRIAGSHLSDLMGMEVRGMPLSAFFATNCRRRFSDMIEEVFETPSTCTLRLSSENAGSQPTLDARMIMLPLKSDLGDVSRMLGCLVSRGALTQTPCRFEITHQDLRPIVPGRMHAPGPERAPRNLPALGDADQRKPTEPAGFHAPATPFEAGTSKRRPPYLRLVKSDK